MKPISPGAFVSWSIAGALSLAVHVVVLLIFAGLGGSGNATPTDPIDANAGVVSSGTADPAGDVANVDATTVNASAPVDPAPATPATPAPTRANGKPSRGGRASDANIPVASATERSFADTHAPATSSAPAGGEVKTRAYTVKPGDNLTRLARDCGATNAELAKLNGVDEKTLANLKVGQVIKLKVKE